MEEKTPDQVRLQDPLSDITRKERRSLLGISILSIAMVKTKLIPTKISALGIEFTGANQKTLLFLVMLIVFYYLCAFTFYGLSDFLAWRIDIFEALKKAYKNAQMMEEREFEIHRKIVSDPRTAFNLKFSSLASILRALFEFLLPLIVGIYSIYILY